MQNHTSVKVTDEKHARAGQVGVIVGREQKGDTETGLIYVKFDDDHRPAAIRREHLEPLG